MNGPVKMARSCVRPTTVRLFSASTCRLRLAETCRVATPGAAVPGQPTGFLPHHGKLASNGMLYISYSNGAGPYDGSSGDVWKFDTSNGTWTRISPVPSTDTANDYFGYGGLSVDARNPNVLVVAALNSWWPDTIIFRSLDAGSTWDRIWNFGSWPTITTNYTLSYASVAPWLTFGDTPSP